MILRILRVFIVHRVFFRSILGDPVKEYPDKDYFMYNCPFQDHEDKKPSFRVHKKGYYCYGCQKKGNYWQFLKDYNKWDDEKVWIYLRNKTK
jgi:DNA primase